MKKFIKIVVVVFVALFIFYNGAQAINENPATVSTNGAPCYYEAPWGCFCFGVGDLCSLATCDYPNDCRGVIVE